MEDQDPRKIEELKKKIVLCAAADVEHIGDPLKQIDTLSILVNELLKDNENGKNDALIGFYANIGKSLAALIKLQFNNKLICRT